MTFLELQTDVMADRFDSSRLASVKGWINYRYGRLWAGEDWTFKYAVVSYNVALNQSSVALNTIQRPIAVWDTTISPSYQPMPAERPEVFYSGASRAASIPARFTVIGTNLILDRPASRATTLQVLGELAFVPLVADGDIPLIPSEFHMMLSHGASAEGLRERNDPFWQDKEASFAAAYQDMKRGYLSSVRTFGGVYPSWP